MSLEIRNLRVSTQSRHGNNPSITIVAEGIQYDLQDPAKKAKFEILVGAFVKQLIAIENNISNPDEIILL